jgi:hypothetical protein
MSLTPREFSGGLTPLREAMNRLFEESFIGPRFDSGELAVSPEEDFLRSV